MSDKINLYEITVEALWTRIRDDTLKAAQSGNASVTHNNIRGEYSEEIMRRFRSHFVVNDSVQINNNHIARWIYITWLPPLELRGPSARD